MNRRKRDCIANTITFIASGISVLILVFILGFVFIRGIEAFSWNFIVSPNDQISTWVEVESNDEIYSRPQGLDENIVWSERWGVGLYQYKDRYGYQIIEVKEIAEDSPFNEEVVVYVNGEPSDETYKIETEQQISRYETNFKKVVTNAKALVDDISQTDEILIEMVIPGGGIRGTLIATMIMIVTTLIFAIPFGISIAIFLSEYARRNKLILVMKSMIDMLAGVPSIVFGLTGMLVFFRIVGTGGPVLIGGSITLVAILLPVIIRSTEEALIAVPQDLRQASLALGANKTQTIFKIVVPAALPGILTATILSVGRIVGESAALILVSGTFINDNPSLNKPGATLAVHIWKVMSGEQPNVPVAAAISILIILLVLILNILLKLISKKIKRI